MLTQLTLKAIAALHDIAGHGASLQDKYKSAPREISTLCALLELNGIIVRLPDAPIGELSSYRLSRPLSEFSLLDVLEATGEHLNCNHPTTEEFYSRFGRIAQRLGVVNQMTRLYLSEIKITEF